MGEWPSSTRTTCLSLTRPQSRTLLRNGITNNGATCPRPFPTLWRRLDDGRLPNGQHNLEQPRVLHQHCRLHFTRIRRPGQLKFGREVLFGAWIRVCCNTDRVQCFCGMKWSSLDCWDLGRASGSVAIPFLLVQLSLTNLRLKL